MKNRKIIILLLMVFLLFVGCGEEESLNEVTVSGVPDQYYTGSPIKPSITVEYKEKILTEGEDYELEYKNNIEVGQATIIIKSKNGKFPRSIETHFNIVNKVNKYDISGTEVSGVEAYYAYEGEPIIPNIHVEDDEGGLTKNIDYTVEYSNNDKPGEAEIIITGIGEYTGTKIVNFSILLKDPVITCSSPIYTGEPVTIASCTDGKIIENEKQTDADVYIVKCASKYDSTRVVSKSCELYPKDIAGATVERINANYEVNKDNSPINPNVNPKVTLDGKVLQKDKDYTLSYVDNTGVGAASVVVKGIGNYTGTIRNIAFYIYSNNCGKSTQNFELIQIDGNRDKDNNNMYIKKVGKDNNVWIDLCPGENAEIRYTIPAVCTKFTERVGTTEGEIKIAENNVGVKSYSELITVSYSDVNVIKNDKGKVISKTFLPFQEKVDGSISYVLTITQNATNVKKFFDSHRNTRYTPVIKIGQTRTYNTEKYSEIKFSGSTLHVRIARECSLKANNLDKSGNIPDDLVINHDKCCCAYKDLTKCHNVNNVNKCPDTEPYEDISQKACSGTSTSTSTTKVCCCTTPSEGGKCVNLEYCLKSSYPYQDATGKRCNSSSSSSSSSSSTSTTTKKCCCSSKTGGSCMEKNSCGGNYPYQDTTGRCK